MPTYSFDEIAINSNEKVKAENIDQTLYIGLEHLESGSLTVKNWGSAVPIKGDKLVMRKGDVLFGKRNAYLRRAAIAPHDGAFSAHGMVFRPKENVIAKEFFPLFIASDYFFDAAIRISVGSLSPTVNWKDLKKIEFTIPTISEQKKLSEILWAMNNTKEAYNRLINLTDDLVKSQFIEMFGEVKDNSKGLPVKHIRDFAECYAGATPSTKIADYWDNGTIPWMASGEIHLGHVYETEKKITQLGYDKCSTKMVPPHTVVIALAGQGKTRGAVALTEIELCTNQSLCAMITDNTVLPDYLYHNLRGRYEEIRNMCAIAEGRGGLNLQIVGNIEVIVPSVGQQEEFISIAEQSDKSKFTFPMVLRYTHYGYSKLSNYVA